MQRKYLIGLTILLGVCLCATVIAIVALAIPETREVIQLYARGASPTRDAIQAIAKGTPTRREIITPPPIVLESATPNILPPLAATPLTDISFETFNALARATFLPRDLFQIAPRLKKISSPLILPTPIARARQVGDKDNFFIVLSAFGGKYRTASATLQLISPHAYFWIEDGQRFDKTALQIAADFFEQNIYPTNHKYFGSERIPGPDGDAHIHIFNGKLDNNTGGYFSSSDTYPLSISQYSNVRHIIYMNLPAVQPGRPEYNADLAHEFQHLIHNNQAEQKAGWIDEGMGDLAVRLNGFPTGSANAYAENPDTQLNTWADDPRANFAHYGGSYLFFNYLQGRFGPEVIRDVILAPCEGICGVQSALNKRANGLLFDDAFADWAATNFLNNPAIENGRYAYSNEKDFKISRETTIARYPMQLAVTMHEYGANYYALDPQARDVTIYFTGTTTAKLLPINAHSGKWMWYSNRADLADMNLTREVDLARVTKATLKFWTWYSIEKDFDYAYVQVSTDGGKTWDILPGKNTTTDDPNGSSFGPAFTGKSGTKEDRGEAQWVQEQMDLSPYAGKKILLRFEYLTDDAFNQPGFVVDDIEIPEINFSDDAEKILAGWTANGFVRVDNVLPQKYIVQIIQIGNSTRVTRLALDAQNRGNFSITGLNNFSKVEVVVTAHAPTTTEATEYQIEVR